MGSVDSIIIYKGGIGNVNGYWEHAAVLQLNQEILAQNGADWSAPPPRLPLTIDNDLRIRVPALAESLPDGFCCKEPWLVWTAELSAEYLPK
jgi:hypothetical protein